MKKRIFSILCLSLIIISISFIDIFAWNSVSWNMSMNGDANYGSASISCDSNVFCMIKISGTVLVGESYYHTNWDGYNGGNGGSYASLPYISGSEYYRQIDGYSTEAGYGSQIRERRTITIY